MNNTCKDKPLHSQHHLLERQLHPGNDLKLSLCDEGCMPYIPCCPSFTTSLMVTYVRQGSCLQEEAHLAPVRGHPACCQ